MLRLMRKKRKGLYKWITGIKKEHVITPTPTQPQPHIFLDNKL